MNFGLFSAPWDMQMSNIVIVHSGRQAMTVQWLLDQLTPFGHQVIDSHDVVAFGESWGEAVLGAIRSCEFVLGIMDDRSDNILFELGYAFGQQKTVILVSTSDVTIPSFLQDVIWIRLQKLDDGSAIQVVGAIQVLAEKRQARAQAAEGMVRALDHREFERGVSKWFVERGAMVSKVGSSGSRDQGFDLLVTDRATSKVYAVELKNVSANNLVSVDAVRQLTSSVMEAQADAGILITASDYTPSAKEFAYLSRVPLFLWSTSDLAERHLPGLENVYIEARPKGRPEGSNIDDYVVEDRNDRVLATFKTQREAINWAKNVGQVPLLARVRHLNDKRSADHWRSA